MHSLKKHSFKGFLLFLCLAFTTASHAQKVVVCDQSGLLYNMDIDNCTFTPINDWGNAFGNAFSIALYKDTLYVLNTNGQLYSMVMNQPASCKFITNSAASNAMTVDEAGMLYIFDNGIVRIDPHDGTRVNLGKPGFYYPSGDLFFYNKKMYMATGNGIVEINLNDPSKSFVYIPTSGNSFFGLVNVPAGCNSNKVYGITNSLYEIDMINKTVSSTPKCVVPQNITIFDAASITENGYNEGVNIDSLFLTHICTPGNTSGNITVKAGTAAQNATLSYSLNGNITNSTGIFPSLIEGTYSIKVTSSNGCFKDTSATLIKGPKPDLLITPVPDTCASGVGSVTLQSTIGNTPMRYALDNASPVIGSSFTKLAAKIYQVHAITNIGCTLDSSFEIVSYTPPNPLQSFTTTPEICDLGSITLTYNNSVTRLKLDNGPDAYNGTFTLLKAKTYTVSLFVNNCRFDTLIEVKKEIPERPSITISADTPTCFNTTDGAIRFTITGKYSPFTISANGTPATGTIFSSLANGTYTYSIKDKGGCVWDTAATIQYRRVRPVTTVSSTAATCWTLNNGTVTATISGQNQPYTFDIFNSTNNPSGATVKDLNSSDYKLFVADKNHCVVDTIPVTVGRIDNKLQVDVITVTPSYCNSVTGSITFAMKANAGPVTFTMNNGTPTTNKAFSNLVSGLYNFNLKDLNNCTSDTSASISIVNLPSPIKELKLTPVICDRKGSIEAILQPGKTGTDYQLNNGAPQTTGLFTSVNEGLNKITFMYSGCPFDTSVTTVKTTTQKPDVSFTNKEVDCYNRNNGSIKVRVDNGAFPYTFSYNNAAFIPDANIYNLAAGDYAVRIKDSYGCLWDTSTTLKQFAVIKPTITQTSKTPVCFVDERASLQVILTGPEFPYQFIINGTSYFSGNEVKLLPGMYNVYVNNNTGCLLDSFKTDLSYAQTGTLPCDTILVPTAFTPNNDLRNDVLRPRGNYGFVSDYVFTVFNRLGEIVFQGRDMEKGWNGFYNGALQPLGTYVWVLSYKTKQGRSVTQKGTAVLVR